MESQWGRVLSKQLKYGTFNWFNEVWQLANVILKSSLYDRIKLEPFCNLTHAKFFIFLVTALNVALD